MHTTEYSGEDGKVTFHHNGGYTGNVIVVMDQTTNEVSIPFAAMEELVLDKLRSEQIELLENAEYPELKRLLGWE